MTYWIYRYNKENGEHFIIDADIFDVGIYNDKHLIPCDLTVSAELKYFELHEVEQYHEYCQSICGQYVMINRIENTIAYGITLLGDLLTPRSK